jgi:methylphosphotriester-DNA--protein-cysteine methyltransferase
LICSVIFSAIQVVLREVDNRQVVVDYYHHRRYHKALGDMTPVDVLNGRREQILERRKEVRLLTIHRRRYYNQSPGELVSVT